MPLLPLVRPLFLFLVVLCLTEFCLGEEKAVFSLVQVRLGLAKYVIKYKSTRDPPMNIDDKKREDKLTVDMKKALNAKPYSTAPPAFRDYYALNFFEDQMVANKLVQTALLNDKSSHSVLKAMEPMNDLGPVRDKIDALNEELLKALYKYYQNPKDNCAEAVKKEVQKASEHQTEVPWEAVDLALKRFCPPGVLHSPASPSHGEHVLHSPASPSHGEHVLHSPASPSHGEHVQHTPASPSHGEKGTHGKGNHPHGVQPLRQVED